MSRAPCSMLPSSTCHKHSCFVLLSTDPEASKQASSSAWALPSHSHSLCPQVPTPVLTFSSMNGTYSPESPTGGGRARRARGSSLGCVGAMMRQRCALRTAQSGSARARPLRQRRKSVRPTNAIGIDLGTTNSAVAVTEEGKTFVVQGPDKTKVTRSIVSYNEEGGIMVGQAAKAAELITNASTFYSIKRLIGRRVSELDSRMYEMLPFFIMENDSSDFAALKCPSMDSILKPEQVSSEILKSLKASAEAYLKEEVKEAVVSVPAYFGPSEREATEVAAHIAGLANNASKQKRAL